MRMAALSTVASLLFASAPLLAQQAPCDADNVGLILPENFCASVFASGLQQPRHMAVAENGDVFVITNRGGMMGRGGGPGGEDPNARGVFRLRDTDRNGRADQIQRVADGMGTGIAIANGALYAEGGNGEIIRYPFVPGTTDLSGQADTIVTGLPMDGSHFQRNFVIRGDELFVNVGSPGNICQQGGRGAPPPPQPDPCPELETRAGVWRFDANRTGQVFSPAQRWVTGFRNAVAMALRPDNNQVYAVQHGRDNVGQALNRGAEYNAENPGEEFHRLVEGADYGWPYCYYSHEHRRKVLGPEYGGNGEEVGRCAGAREPIYAFPGHWGPNALLFYTGNQFPAEYREGVFVAFHGSWNRAPLPQAGYNITFLPLDGDTPTGSHRVFADGFDQRLLPQPPATPLIRRPTGLAQMPDGSILVSEDGPGGTILRIYYRGP